MLGPRCNFNSRFYGQMAGYMGIRASLLSDLPGSCARGSQTIWGHAQARALQDAARLGSPLNRRVAMASGSNRILGPRHRPIELRGQGWVGGVGVGGGIFVVFYCWGSKMCSGRRTSSSSRGGKSSSSRSGGSSSSGRRWGSSVSGRRSPSFSRDIYIPSTSYSYLREFV